MSVSPPAESFPVRGKTGTSMRLPLNSVGDHNGNAFPMSSSSSSSSSSCMGESSPESLRSGGSLSSGRIESPQDYDMLEVTLMATVMTKTDAPTHVVSWGEEDGSKREENGSVSVERIQTATELSESNDNSMSVYLDANSDEYQDTWNDNLTLALSLAANSCSRGDNGELSSGSSIRGRRGSSTPDSDATEVPADDDYDDEEALFVSVSSDIVVQRTSTTLTSSPSQGLLNRDEPAVMAELQPEATKADGERSEVPMEEAQVACPLDSPEETPTELPPSEGLSESLQVSSLTPSAISQAQVGKGVASLTPEEAARPALSSKPSYSTTRQPARAAKTRAAITISAGSKPAASTAVKTSALASKKNSKLDLKNIQAKVGSRSPQSTPKTPTQSKSALANGKKAAPRKEDLQSSDGGKRQRSSAGPVKVALVLAPIRGKSINRKTSHKNAAIQPPQPDKRSVTISRTLSSSTSSLGSEVTGERVQQRPRKPDQEVSEKHGATVTRKQPGEAGGEACEGEQREAASQALLPVANVEKPRNPSRKVSSKLGPVGRQQGRSTRVDKGPAPTPVSGTGPPGQGSPGPRQAQTDVSTLGEGGQRAVAGSPTRVKQSQSQGVSKSRERPSALVAPSPATSSSKPVANQQPALGVAGRPTASKLPVKGLPTSLSSSSLGSNENNGATCKASPAGLAPTGPKPDERPSRITAAVSGTKPSIPSTTVTTCTSASSDTVSSGNSSGVVAAPKPPPMRSRALSLQARTTASGLKAPSVTNHSTTKTAANQSPLKTPAAAGLGLTKQMSHYPLQRSGSARLSRLNSAVWAQQLCVTALQTPVDKNKPRDVPAKANNNISVAAAPAGGTNQSQQNPDPAPVPDVVNANAPVAPALPVPDTSTSGSGTTGASGLGVKARTASRSSPKTGFRLQNASKPGVAGTVAADGTLTSKQNQNKEQAEKKNQAISQLRKLLVQGNKRVEALATVIQHLFTEREEALKQRKDLAVELATLRDELVTSSQCCERLHKEKEEVRVGLEDALKRLEEQHREELVQLEDRLRSFYQTEWDKVHQTYQEEADKCRRLMEQQVEELRSRQEAERKNQEVGHIQRMESLKQEYETSMEELKRLQQTDVENLEKNLKETETSLSERICELSAEKEALNEKLNAEEERRRRILSDKNLKDSHTVYLEQELDSLKVVLEIKNNQLHLKEKKLMEMDKLLETNVKLEECLKKVQQENEDYKARMDKHAALSKQLSNEQAILQQTLQKESKVNKRLSMENEELLWKLHNGDLLGSPRRLSPTSPFSSPRNSASFPTATPLSPR
ncbi:uncharacterized protein ACBR49_001281 [Aulostomus maculatus]